MKTMQVRITKADDRKWYNDEVGEVYTVAAKAWDDGDLHEVVGKDSFGIHKDHFEIINERKIVEHEGVKYSVPTWAKFLTRDKAGDTVYCFDVKPDWAPCGYSTKPEWRVPAGVKGRVYTAEVYVEPKPEGNFIKEI